MAVKKKGNLKSAEKKGSALAKFFGLGTSKIKKRKKKIQKELNGNKKRR